MNQDVCVIIPVYNEGKIIATTIKEVMRSFPFVVCVNDGSKDNSTDEILKTKAKLVNHPINLGQGAALQTGIDFALQYPEIKYFVTFDADGQHGIKDVKQMLSHIKTHDNIDIVLGSRFLGSTQDMTRMRKQLLRLAVVFSNFTTGLRLTDAHNGLRVFNRRVAELLDITMPDMAHASEVIHRIAEKNFAYEELPITIAYTDYSRAKGQSMMNAFNISFDILLQRFTKK